MNSFAMLPLLPKLSEAACKDYQFPDLFFPDGKKQEADRLKFVQAICNGCIEREECLEFALEQKIEHGIWAGTTPAMRKAMKVNPTNQYFEPSIADRIRELTTKGKSPQQIARLLGVETSYVKLALTRTTRNKGEIQSQITTENLSGELFSSSECQ
jgi:WhiB family redox-sensing transcriptional regulator